MGSLKFMGGVFCCNCKSFNVCYWYNVGGVYVEQKTGVAYQFKVGGDWWFNGLEEGFFS